MYLSIHTLLYTLYPSTPTIYPSTLLCTHPSTRHLSTYHIFTQLPTMYPCTHYVLTQTPTIYPSNYPKHMCTHAIMSSMQLSTHPPTILTHEPNIYPHTQHFHPPNNICILGHLQHRLKLLVFSDFQFFQGFRHLVWKTKIRFANIDLKFCPSNLLKQKEKKMFSKFEIILHSFSYKVQCWNQRP